jgi:putative ABC transport system permease protein
MMPPLSAKWRAPWAHVFMATDLRRAVQGQRWLAAVAVGCLAFTSAVSSVLYAGVAALSLTLRTELATQQGDVVMVQPRSEQHPCQLDVIACASGAEQGARAMAAFQRRVAPTPTTRDVATLWRSVTGIYFAGASRRAELIGTDAALFRLQPLALNDGRLWTEAEERSGRPVVVVGRALFDSLARARPIAGQRLRASLREHIRVGSLWLEIIGVVTSGTVAAVQVDHAVLVPRLLYARIQPLTPHVPTAVVARAGGTLAAPSMIDALHVFERQRPQLARSLGVVTTADQLGELATMDQALTRGVAGLSLVLTLSGLVAVAALMVTIARAHRRAVGVARALGATRVVVAVQGAVIGSAMGLAGVCTGAIAAVAVISQFPVLLDVTPLSFASVLAALVQGAAPGVLASVVVGTWTFGRLARQRPALLLA